jgi:hypothetical protein
LYILYCIREWLEVGVVWKNFSESVTYWYKITGKVPFFLNELSHHNKDEWGIAPLILSLCIG